MKSWLHHLRDDINCETGNVVELHTLVSTRVLEENNFALLEMQASLLGEEKVGTLNDVFEMGLPLSIDQCRHVGDVDSFGTVQSQTISKIRRI